AQPIGSLGCTIDGVAAAAERFDVAASGFSGRVMNHMLPPEAENLHRIVHSLEVLKNSLLRELDSSSGDSRDPESQAGCSRYFSGVTQLEADLAHYRGLLAPKKVKKPPKVTPVASQPSQRKPLQNLPPSQPLRQGQLQPLELAPSGATRGFGTGAAGGVRPALDVGSFR
ncbi:unnamed protein product, partial [Polarella glacialis]